MARKVALLSLLIALLGTLVYADVCTVSVMAKAKSLTLKEMSYTVAIDYGQGKVEGFKTDSLADFLADMESKGWQMDTVYSLGGGVVQIIFRK